MKEKIVFRHYGIEMTVIHDFDTGRHFVTGKGSNVYFSTIDEVKVYFEKKVRDNLNKWSARAREKAGDGKTVFTREEYLAACSHRGSVKGLRDMEGFVWGYIVKCYEGYLTYEQKRKVRNEMKFSVRHYKCHKDGSTARTAKDITKRFIPESAIIGNAVKLRKTMDEAARKKEPVRDCNISIPARIERMTRLKISRLFKKYKVNSPLVWGKHLKEEVVRFKDAKSSFTLLADEIINVFHVERRTYPTFCLVSRNGFDIQMQYKQDRWNFKLKDNRTYEKNLYSHSNLLDTINKPGKRVKGHKPPAEKVTANQASN